MTSQRRIVVPAVTGVVAVVLIVVGVGLRWAPWLTIVAVLVCLAVGALAYLAGQPQRQEIFVPPPPVPEPLPSVQVVVVQGINLASAWPDYEFTFDATVYWRQVGNQTAPPHVRPGARGIDTIIARAATVAATERPHMAARLQHRLDDVLGVVEADQSDWIEAWADQVRITLSETDARRLRTMADIRKDRVLWEHERRFECDRRKYLTDDVLGSTGSALVWWLSRNEADVTGAADLIGTMARLSSAARGEHVPELFRHLLPPSLLPPAEPEQAVFTALGSDGAGQPSMFDFAQFTGSRSPIDLVTALMGALRLDDEQRALFAARVATNIESTGDAETAEQLRRRFDVLTEQFTVDQEPELGNVAEQGAHAWPAENGNPRTGTATADTPD